MEKRINSAFPQYEGMAGPLPEMDAAPANRENLLKIFEELPQTTKGQGDAAFRRKSKERPKEAAIALAMESGAAGGKKWE
ncbi:MAG: hypothetical protein LBO03_07420 [Acidaminococcales bacterium]|jgi:hypothetical protein|nr:hypothetical protein [Acidaminococcales bacterium]